MVSTNNVYFATFLVTSGLFVSDAKVVTDPKHGKTVQFTFYGTESQNEEKLRDMYEKESATVNIRNYLDNLVLIRNMMYSKLKRIEETGNSSTNGNINDNEETYKPKKSGEKRNGIRNCPSAAFHA